MLRTLLRFTQVQSVQLIRWLQQGNKRMTWISVSHASEAVALGGVGFLFVLFLAGSKLP